MSRWTEERVALLKELVAKNLSNGQIAAKLGGDITRSTVAGKIYRLGLSGARTRSNGKSRKTRPAAPKTAKRSAVTKPKSESRVAISEADDAHPTVDVDVDETQYIALPSKAGSATLCLTAERCRWPIGDVGNSNFHFCCQPTHEGSPYCRAHMRKSVRTDGKSLSHVAQRDGDSIPF